MNEENTSGTNSIEKSTLQLLLIGQWLFKWKSLDISLFRVVKQCKYFYLHHETGFIVVTDQTNGFGIKSLVLFIYGQTFCGRTCTLNASKTLIMNAKLKFDQFSLVIPTTNPFFYMNIMV